MSEEDNMIRRVHKGPKKGKVFTANIMRATVWNIKPSVSAHYVLTFLYFRSSQVSNFFFIIIRHLIGSRKVANH